MTNTEIIEIQGFGRFEIPAGLSDDEIATISEDIVQSERSQTVTPVEAAGAAGKGVNVGLANFTGSIVGLFNQLPVIMDSIEPYELGKSALNQFIRLREHHRGTPPGEMTPKYKRPESKAVPFTQNPVGGSAQLRKGLTQLGMGYQNIQDLPFPQRPFAQGGEVVGMSAPIAALPPLRALRLAPGQTAKGTFAPLVEAAAQKPGRTAAQEGLVTALSAGGSGAAQQFFPGDPTARTIGEMAPPFLPSVVAARMLPGVIKSGVRAAEPYLPGGADRRAAREIQSRMLGEDVEGIARQLRQAEGPLTSAQITGSPYLSSLEKHLIEIDRASKTRYEGQLEQSLEANRKAFDEIVAQGDPQAIKEAAQQRINFLNESLNRRVARADELLAAAADKTTSRSDAAELSRAARDILERAKKAARDTEDELWEAINRTKTIRANNTLDAYQVQTDDLLPGEVLDSITHKSIKSILKRSKQKNPKKPITSGELLRLRSRIRRAQREGDMPDDSARRLNNVIDGITDDLVVMDSNAATSAIDFSRNLNNVFKQGMPRKILRRTAAGGIDPSETLRIALSPREKGAVSYRQLREAAGFPEPPLGAPGGQEMRQLQEDFLRRLAAETAGYADEGINPTALTNFIKRNDNVIKELGIAAQFADTAAAATIAQNVQKAAKATKSFAEIKSFTSKVAKGDIDKLIERALVAPNKVEEFHRLIKIARRDRSGKALDGLRYSLFQKILDASTSGKMLSSRALNEVLNAPAMPSSALPEGAPIPTLRETLVRERLITPQQNENFDVLLAKLDNFENAVKTPGALSDVLETEDAMFELLTRILGANVGGMSGLSQASGAGLVVAHAGSKEAQRRLIKVPRFRVKSVMVEAMFNPKFMAKLLEMPVGLRAEEALQRQINAFLLAAGLRSATDEERTE